MACCECLHGASTPLAQAEAIADMLHNVVHVQMRFIRAVAAHGQVNSAWSAVTTGVTPMGPPMSPSREHAGATSSTIVASVPPPLTQPPPYYSPLRSSSEVGSPLIVPESPPTLAMPKLESPKDVAPIAATPLSLPVLVSLPSATPGTTDRDGYATTSTAKPPPEQVRELAPVRRMANFHRLTDPDMIIYVESPPNLDDDLDDYHLTMHTDSDDERECNDLLSMAPHADAIISLITTSSLP